MKFVRFAGFCGVFGSVLPIIMILTATFLAPCFSWSTDSLSQLGVGRESELFNSALMLRGALNFLFAIGLHHYFIYNKERLFNVGIASTMLGSIFLALIGVFTIDYNALHAIVADAYFVLAPLGLILIGFGIKGSIPSFCKGRVTIKKLSIVSGIAALVAIWALPIIIFMLSLAIGFAVPEIIQMVTLAVWTLFMATKLIRQ